MRWGRRKHVSTALGPALNGNTACYVTKQTKNTFLVVVRPAVIYSEVLKNYIEAAGFLVVFRQYSTPGFVLY